jgi:drug/metabolite transporter (DMT)-like permease
MTAFLHSIRWAQNRRAHIYAVAASNYLVAAVVFVWWVIFARVPVHSDVLIRGVIIGLFYGTAFFLIIYGFDSIGVGRTSTIVNLALAIPVLASIFIWHEHVGALLISGIILAAISIPLIFLPGSSAQKLRIRPSFVFAFTFLFIAQGLAYTIMKSFEQLGRPAEKPVLLAGIFIAATFLTVIIMIFARAKADGRDLFHGIFTGICNIISNVGLVVSLTLAAGTIVFPTVTAGTIIAVTLFSIILWNERYRPLTWLGLLLAVISVILINL